MVDHIESMTSSILAVPSSSPEEEAQQQARKSEESKSQSPAAEEIERYRRRIEELSQFLPNYEILGDNFYYEGARILRIDSHNGTIPSEYRREAVYEDPAAIYEFLVGDLEDVSARVIMVEDSSWALCLGLGAAFSLNPEFFIEHLHKQVPGPCGKNQSQHYTNGTFYANLYDRSNDNEIVGDCVYELVNPTSCSEEGQSSLMAKSWLRCRTESC